MEISVFIIPVKYRDPVTIIKSCGKDFSIAVFKADNGSFDENSANDFTESE